MIAVLARIRVREGQEGEFEAAFTERRQRVLATEPDALQYDLYRTPGAATDFLVIERYPSLEAHRNHLAMSRDHQRMMACFAQPPEVTTFEAVAGAS